jgi:hypothetical protein
MPRGHKGEKRPADVIGDAVHIVRIAAYQCVLEEIRLEHDKLSRND